MIYLLLRMFERLDRRVDASIQRHVTAALSVSPDDVLAEEALLRFTTLPARVVAEGTS